MAPLRYGPRHGISIASTSKRRAGSTPIYTPPALKHATTEKRREWAIKAGVTNRNKKGVSLSGKTQPAFIDERADAEARMRERLKRCVELMVFGIEELIAAPPAVRKRKPGMGLDAPEVDWEQTLNIGYMVDLVNKIATAAHVPHPVFDYGRKPGMKSHRKCLDCGAPLGPDDGATCSDCYIPFFERQSDQRAMREDVETIEDTIDQLNERLRHDAKGHG